MKHFNPKTTILFCFLFLAATYPLSAQNYTWMKGSNVAAQNGYYGTSGVASPLNNPGGRGGSAYWKDAAGNFWLFGGIGYDAVGGQDYLNDLWKYTVSTNQWTWMGGDSLVYQSGVYGTIGVPASSNKPGSRIGAVAWTDASGNLWMFGGTGLDATSNDGELNDLWKYTISTNQWTWIRGSNAILPPASYGTQGVSAPSNDPGGSFLGTGWTDASGNLWLFGGEGYSAAGYGDLNDLWKYTISTNEWTWMKGAGVEDQNGSYGTISVPASANNPGGRYGCGGWTDASGNFWVFGGLGFDGSSNYDYLSDLWKYTISTNQWTWIKGSNLAGQPGNYGTQGVPAAVNMPGARVGFATWRDASNGELYLFGGNGNYSLANQDDMNDLWKYTPSTNEWTWLKGSNSAPQIGVYGTQGVSAPANTPGSRVLMSYWTDNTNNLWLFGGIGSASSFSSYGELNDLWMISICAAPSILISSSQPSVCAGSSATLTATGAQTYSWSTPSGSGATTSTVSISPSATTVYAVAGTSLGCTAYKSFTLTVSPLPVVSFSANHNTVCKGEPVVFTASGANSYSWNTAPSATGTSVTVTPTITTVYQVSGQDLDGCVGTFTASLLVNPCTGIDQQNITETLLSIYPNPTNGDFTVRSATFGENTKLIILNNLGQKVMERDLTDAQTHVQTGFQSGVYFYQLLQNDIKAGSGKLIVE